MEAWQSMCCSHHNKYQNERKASTSNAHITVLHQGLSNNLLLSSNGVPRKYFTNVKKNILKEKN
jgi:hypothetical protein